MVASQVIGCGAAGGKAAVNLIENNIMPADSILLVNSTDKDLPSRDCKFVKISDSRNIEELEGCAKEPLKGMDLTVAAIENGVLDISSWIKPTTKKVFVIASLEGGTGCGSSVVIAQYISDKLGIKTHVIGISGFEEDPRGLKNTITFFKSLSSNITVSIISNKKFLKEANNDYSKAEKLCNSEISTDISILIGNSILPSEKNIDDNDLFKLTTEYGFTNVCSTTVKDKIRNKEDFNNVLKDMIDNSKSMDLYAPKQTLMGVIINLPKDQWGNIDYSYSILKEYYNSDDSSAYDVFTHLEDITAPNENNVCVEPFIAFINAGMELPTKEVMSIYDRYTEGQAAARKAKQSRNNFFDSMQNIVFDDDDEFDMDNRSKGGNRGGNDFFANFKKKDKPSEPVSNDNLKDNY